MTNTHNFKIGDIVYYGGDVFKDNRPPMIIVATPPEGERFPVVAKYLEDFDEEIVLHMSELENL
jgi:hypothetical protein